MDFNPYQKTTTVTAMHKSLIILLIILISCKNNENGSSTEGFPVLPSFFPPQNTERFSLFDLNWRFHKGELIGAEIFDFDDSKWERIDLPHDWSIEDLPNQKDGEIIGPFDKNSIGKHDTGFSKGGTGWYRKTFTLNETDLQKEITIYFDGIYHETEVWLNGNYVGSNLNGYTPFYFKLNMFLNSADQSNILAIRVNNFGVNSRWYSGSGIYRHVWLRITKDLNIPVWGIYVTTPETSEAIAKINAKISVENAGHSLCDVIIRSTIIAPDGNEVQSSEQSAKLEKKATNEINQAYTITNPLLWSVETPWLYTLRIEVIAGGKIIDVEKTNFGIRSISFSAENGFLLNGKPVLLKGACIHHDNGPLGANAIDRAEQRKIEILKSNGFNAIRTSHNPPSQSFLDACDRLGMLVIDEAFDMWETPKRQDDYHRFFKACHAIDLRSMILRDRNHPSVIMWSIGNEIPERADSSGLRIAKDLIQIVKNLDATRPVTNAICDFWETKDRKWEETLPAFALLNVSGYNYAWTEYENDHTKYPQRIMVGTESHPKAIYENWTMAQDKSYVIGDFVWTGMDYLGEAGIGHTTTDTVATGWPWINANCGDIDLIGFKKPQSYYRDVVWDLSKLEMAVEEIAPEGKEWLFSAWGWRREHQSWNWQYNEGKKMNVYVYSKYDKVRLELNGKVIETQTSKPDSKFTYKFSVPYKPGELKAIAIFKGREKEFKSIKTTGPVERIKMTTDRPYITPDKNDLAYVTVELTDANGNRVHNFDSVINFNVSGEAEIIAVGNGNPVDPKSFRSDICNTYHGRCIVILKPTGKPGKIFIKAKSRNLLFGLITIDVK